VNAVICPIFWPIHLEQRLSSSRLAASVYLAVVVGIACHGALCLLPDGRLGSAGYQVVCLQPPGWQQRFERGKVPIIARPLSGRLRSSQIIDRTVRSLIS
jgi:hypothetical protein